MKWLRRLFGRPKAKPACRVLRAVLYAKPDRGIIIDDLTLPRDLSPSLMSGLVGGQYMLMACNDIKGLDGLWHCKLELKPVEGWRDFAVNDSP